MDTVLGALFFGLVAYVGVLLAGTLKYEAFDDGPVPGEPPVPWIVCGSAVLGALITTQAVRSEQIILAAIVVCALAAIWCTDVRYGIVPDLFTLGPLTLILLLAIVQHQPWLIVSAAVPFVPFAIAAMLSNGRGMGWGDVKLAALGGAVLGLQLALLAFTAGCLVAVVYAYFRGRRGQPIAFAPYLAGAIAAAIPVAMPLGALL